MNTFIVVLCVTGFLLVFYAYYRAKREQQEKLKGAPAQSFDSNN
jgi:heme/copper-type cytochrome/quinol oxidase subunit 2